MVLQYDIDPGIGKNLEEHATSGSNVTDWQYVSNALTGSIWQDSQNYGFGSGSYWVQPEPEWRLQLYSERLQSRDHHESSREYRYAGKGGYWCPRPHPRRAGAVRQRVAGIGRHRQEAAAEIASEPAGR